MKVTRLNQSKIKNSTVIINPLFEKLDHLPGKRKNPAYQSYNLSYLHPTDQQRLDRINFNNAQNEKTSNSNYQETKNFTNMFCQKLNLKTGDTKISTVDILLNTKPEEIRK